MAIAHRRRANRVIANTANIEKELAKKRPEIRLTLRRLGQLPEEIQNATEIADEIRRDNEFELKGLRSDAKRFYNLVAHLEELESGPVGKFSDERTQKYLEFLDEIYICEKSIALLEEEIVLADMEVEELYAQEVKLENHLDTLIEQRDRLVDRREEHILRALPIHKRYHHLVDISYMKNGQTRINIGRQDIPGARATYRKSGTIDVSKRFMEQLELLQMRDTRTAD